MTTQVIAIAGAPGSGKTHRANEHVQRLTSQGISHQLIDDEPEGNSIDVILAEFAKQNIEALIVAHPAFCFEPIRGMFELKIRRYFPDSDIQWEFFENNPEKCLKNVKHRNDGRAVKNAIIQYSKWYFVPKEYEAIPIWQPPTD